MIHNSTNQMRDYINLLNEGMNTNAELKKVQSVLKQMDAELESYMTLLKNKTKLMLSVSERLHDITKRNPDKINRIKQLQQKFLSRMEQAASQADITKAHQALLDTLDREKII